MRAGAVIVAMMLAGALALSTGTAQAKSSKGKGPNVLRVGSSGTCPGAKFTRIQDAIDAARQNTTIMVCAGTYPEQLVVSKKVKIVGSGHPVVQPVGMTANTTSLRTGDAIAAAAVVSAAATIDGVDFDLSQNGLALCDMPSLMGVFFRGTSGTLRNTRIHGVHYAPAAGACQSGAAVVVQGNGASATRVDMTNNVISDYQRAGIIINERGARGMLRGNTITGSGVTSDTVQNGIQVGFGATATILNNVVQNNAGPSGSDCTFDAGNLIFQANGGYISRNTFTGNTSGIIVNGSNNRILFNTVDGLAAGVAAGLDGISAFGDRNLVNGNTVRNLSEVGIRIVGNGNITIRNNVSETHEATLCTADRALPGCAGTLSVCGVGLWISGGTGNTSVKNVLVNNDVALRDEGHLTVNRGPAAH